MSTTKTLLAGLAASILLAAGSLLVGPQRAWAAPQTSASAPTSRSATTSQPAATTPQPAATTSQPTALTSQPTAPTPSAKAPTRKPAVGPSSRPAPQPQARNDVKRAEGLFALGRYGEALALYEQGYSQMPSRVGLLLRIAGCQERLGGEGRLRRAKVNYQRYLELRPKSSARPGIEKRIVLLERRIEKASQGLDAAEPAGTPVYKKWWFWTGMIVVVGAVVTGIILASQVNDDIPQTSQPLRSPASSSAGLRWRSPVLLSF